MRSYDVLVIGGGPAGSAAAIMLARKGVSVLVVERARFPRHHVGESTLLSIHSPLEWLGLEDKVAAAGFRRKTGASYIWGRDRAPWSFHFGEILDQYEDALPYSYEVERDRFDQILLDHARESGAEVQEGTAARRLQVTGDRIVGAVIDDGSGEERVEAEIVIDASGQARLAGAQFGWQQVNPRLRNLSLYGYWGGGPPRYERLGGDLTADDQSNILICSTPWGWIWVIPQRDDRVSVGAVVRGGGGDRGPRLEGKGLPERYLKLIDSCKDLAPVMGDLCFNEAEPVRSISDWSYRCTRMSAPGLFVTGDAACFVDPILSSGLHLALRGGISAACATRSTIDGQNAGLIREWYEATYRVAYHQYEEMALWWYHGDQNRDAWFEVSRDLVDPERFGKPLSDRQAFVHVAAGVQPPPYVQVPVDGPVPLCMSALFHAHGTYVSHFERLRERFGVIEPGPQEPVAAPSAGPSTPMRGGVSLREGVRLVVAPDPLEVRIGVFCPLPTTMDDGVMLDVTALYPVLARLDGTRTLRQIGSDLDLGADEQRAFEWVGELLDRRGVLTGAR